MERDDIDYEKMKEEYDRVHPLKLCSEPFLEGEELDSVGVNSVYKCYENYLEVAKLVKGIQRALPQALAYIAETIINLSEKVSEIAYTFYKERGGEKDKRTLDNDRIGYTQSIRHALIASGEVIAFVYEKSILQKKLPLSNMQLIHSLLLTLTAF